ncbi:hypothetical protein BB561_005914 [Smittium simulii]|uniref:DUF7707 domain-containing protein n=1 Tax=Smittium simulii TaxID=133385 RepID=A0A2T9Y7L0_9FUNG|nr:hypothetical protein BB561_005914 [Smittium simulii]
MGLRSVVALAVFLLAQVFGEKWDITSIPIAERNGLCEAQISTCINDCGGKPLAPRAFCNPETMGWGCGCKNKSPSTDPWSWPLTQRDCLGNFNKCKDDCNTETSKRQECFVQCSNVWKCSTADAPISYLVVQEPNDIPAYYGPEVTYAGNIPGTKTKATIQNDRIGDISSEDYRKGGGAKGAAAVGSNKSGKKSSAATISMFTSDSYIIYSAAAMFAIANLNYANPL